MIDHLIMIGVGVLIMVGRRNVEAQSWRKLAELRQRERDAAIRRTEDLQTRLIKAWADLEHQKRIYEFRCHTDEVIESLGGKRTG